MLINSTRQGLVSDCVCCVLWYLILETLLCACVLYVNVHQLNDFMHEKEKEKTSKNSLFEEAKLCQPLRKQDEKRDERNKIETGGSWTQHHQA